MVIGVGAAPGSRVGSALIRVRDRGGSRMGSALIGVRDRGGTRQEGGVCAHQG